MVSKEKKYYAKKNTTGEGYAAEIMTMQWQQNQRVNHITTTQKPPNLMRVSSNIESDDDSSSTDTEKSDLSQDDASN